MLIVTPAQPAPALKTRHLRKDNNWEIYKALRPQGDWDRGGA
eukprot:CAMPEP_0194766270 /NCGR_PEP_ID=MMETSP0323_2-20130528/30354_1 /TAXON_ID=2866 ORGANISM="Crypthecodinium cohnii, Strain Seligo" /NCGR_SAMPLE_ID=MMETSP0323_2 /ASSEMBLY_ACC=CAM_ASM_000346 /LENGTH=41 /DNA_ID= /DNA_START= /DNA_END= /DNA_ORIENTATION=